MTTQTTVTNSTAASGTPANQIVERYIAVWNETDTQRRSNLIAQTYSEDAHYIDPLMEGQGHAGISAMVQGVQDRFAGHQFRQIGQVDAHHNWVRFSWELAPTNGPALVAGTDFAELDANGRLHTVTGFLDLMPGGA